MSWAVYNPAMRLLRVPVYRVVCPYQWMNGCHGGPHVPVPARGLRVRAVRRLKLRQSTEEAKSLSTHKAWVSSLHIFIVATIAHLSFDQPSRPDLTRRARTREHFPPRACTGGWGVIDRIRIRIFSRRAKYEWANAKFDGQLT